MKRYIRLKEDYESKIIDLEGDDVLEVNKFEGFFDRRTGESEEDYIEVYYDSYQGSGFPFDKKRGNTMDSIKESEILLETNNITDLIQVGDMVLKRDKVFEVIASEYGAKILVDANLISKVYTKVHDDWILVMERDQLERFVLHKRDYV